jgi:Fe-S cluster assembly protein SufD
MSSVTETTSVAGASAALGRALGDAEWLSRLRAGAADTAGRLALPDSRRERPWTYLDVSGLDVSAYAPLTTAGEGPESGTPFGERASAGIVQHEGATVAVQAGDHVSVTDFASAEGDDAAAVQQHLATGVQPGRSKFTALHYAYLRGGVLVNVARDAELPAPVRIARTFETRGQFAAPHTLIVTGANSRVDVIEDYRSSDADMLVVPVVEVVPGPGSRVRYTALHRWGTATRVFTEQHLRGVHDSEFVGLNVVTGGSVVKGHLHAALEGRGASSELFGLALGTGTQHVDFYTVQDHIAPDTRSDLLYKSALKETARSVYYGLTRVGLEARNADANQENRNLLLSKTAKADSDPVLEILTNDVIRVSHGATAGPVDQEQLYYLQARGIPYAQGEAMLVRAFLDQVLDRVPDEALREELGTIIDEKLAAS